MHSNCYWISNSPYCVRRPIKHWHMPPWNNSLERRNQSLHQSTPIKYTDRISHENKMVSFTLLHAPGFWGGLRTQRPEYRPPA